MQQAMLLTALANVADGDDLLLHAGLSLKMAFAWVRSSVASTDRLQDRLTGVWADAVRSV